jgi:hypothetical protein
LVAIETEDIVDVGHHSIDGQILERGRWRSVKLLVVLVDEEFSIVGEVAIELA